MRVSSQTQIGGFNSSESVAATEFNTLIVVAEGHNHMAAHVVGVTEATQSQRFLLGRTGLARVV